MPFSLSRTESQEVFSAWEEARRKAGFVEVDMEAAQQQAAPVRAASPAEGLLQCSSSRAASETSEAPSHDDSLAEPSDDSSRKRECGASRDAPRQPKSRRLSEQGQPKPLAALGSRLGLA